MGIFLSFHFSLFLIYWAEVSSQAAPLSANTASATVPEPFGKYDTLAAKFLNEKSFKIYISAFFLNLIIGRYGNKTKCCVDTVVHIQLMMTTSKSLSLPNATR